MSSKKHRKILKLVKPFLPSRRLVKKIRDRGRQEMKSNKMLMSFRNWEKIYWVGGVVLLAMRAQTFQIMRCRQKEPDMTEKLRSPSWKIFTINRLLYLSKLFQICTMECSSGSLRPCQNKWWWTKPTFRFSNSSHSKSRLSQQNVWLSKMISNLWRKCLHRCYLMLALWCISKYAAYMLTSPIVTCCNIHFCPNLTYVRISISSRTRSTMNKLSDVCQR